MWGHSDKIVVCKPEREFSETKVLLSDKKRKINFIIKLFNKKEVEKEEQRTRMQVRQTKDE